MHTMYIYWLLEVTEKLNLRSLLKFHQKENVLKPNSFLKIQDILKKLPGLYGKTLMGLREHPFF
jgi:hypothetical protein